MKEPIELLEERIFEIQGVLESMIEENPLELNNITELYNRYVSAYNLIRHEMVNTKKTKKHKQNKNSLLLCEIFKQKDRNRVMKNRIDKYYGKARRLKTKLEKYENVYKDETIN